jgi:hypothetical protein
MKKHVYAVASRTFENLVGNLQVAVTLVDANRLWHVRENAVCSPPPALKLRKTA